MLSALTAYETAYITAKLLILGLVLWGCWWVAERSHPETHAP
jgi:hypothetical protein